MIMKAFDFPSERMKPKALKMADSSLNGTVKQMDRISVNGVGY